MTFVWTEYLTLAEELTKITIPTISEEARLRCALSRAYYAVFHVALRVAQRRGGYVRTPGSGTHEDLIVYFMAHSRSEWRTVGADLRTLYQLRIQADYQDTMPAANLTRNNVIFQILLADSIITALNALR